VPSNRFFQFNRNDAAIKPIRQNNATTFRKKIWRISDHDEGDGSRQLRSWNPLLTLWATLYRSSAAMVPLKS